MGTSIFLRVEVPKERTSYLHSILEAVEDAIALRKIVQIDVGFDYHDTFVLIGEGDTFDSVINKYLKKPNPTPAA